MYFQLCIEDADQASSHFVIKPKISYAEATTYFEESEEQMVNSDCGEIRTNLPEDLHVKVRQCYINKIINNIIYKLLIFYIKIDID